MIDLDRELKALANKRRLAILKLLKREKEFCVGRIADEIKLSIKSTSRHLRVLESADVVAKEQRSVQVFYSIGQPQSSTTKHILSLL